MTVPPKLDLEAVISWILRAGVLASVATLLLGILMWIVAGNTGYPVGEYPTTWPQVLTGVLTFKPLAVVQAGLLVLIMTPVIQVGASVAMFSHERDRVFAALALAVLSLLLAGISYGTVGH